ncbi:hypothetical protein ACHMW5_36060 (plasmid) [Azospirillum melinis]|uniref:hypothetical protein n=1 Tax=Azospirillum melinis TaxID=328839 RepID=UPI003757F298
MSDQDERKPIRPPAADPKREIGRTITEAVVELVPGGNVLTGLYRTTHPPKAEQDREAWQEAISDRTNEHSERLDQHEKLLAPKQTV